MTTMASGKGTGPLEPKGDRLPAGRFGSLSGTFLGRSDRGYGANHPNPTHVYVWLTIPEGADSSYAGGRYECAIHVRSLPEDAVGYYVMDEELEGDPPAMDFTFDGLSYADLGLTDDDFKDLEPGSQELAELVLEAAEGCGQLVVHGWAYAQERHPMGGAGAGFGIHDTHLDTHENDGGSKDGAVAFYTRRPSDGGSRWTVRWIFVKFQRQSLGAE